MKKYNYDIEKYNFSKIVKELFVCDTLHKLHNKLPSDIQYKELHKIGEDNKTWFHKTFYKPINEGDSNFQRLYDKFIVEVISKFINEKNFLYQKTPTFRVHAPENIAVGGWHRDSDYNHPTEEINFIVPLTKAYGTNTIWAESVPGLKDFRPFIMDVGDIVQFDGNKCVHGNKANTTGVTRVSFDFRVIPFSVYKPDPSLKSIVVGKKFLMGDYYALYQEGLTKSDSII